MEPIPKLSCKHPYLFMQIIFAKELEPLCCEITEVVLKTGMNETSLWNARTGFPSQSEQ